MSYLTADQQVPYLLRDIDDLKNKVDSRDAHIRLLQAQVAKYSKAYLNVLDDLDMFKRWARLDIS